MVEFSLVLENAVHSKDPQRADRVTGRRMKGISSGTVGPLAGFRYRTGGAGDGPGRRYGDRRSVVRHMAGVVADIHGSLIWLGVS